VRDTAAFYAAVEERYRNPALPEIGLIQHPGKERLRIGLFTDTPYNTPSHTDSVEVSVNAGKLCEDLGHNSPTLSHVPPKIGYLGPEVGFETHFERIRQYVAFTPLQNAAGAPAISLPLGFSRNGLPIGVQFAAAYGQEKRLLELPSNSKKPGPGPWADSSRLWW
jgi:Asp-tRNA(Asn)/Glu-tRNA(Gln) amidotransferase A subunit family amidase